MSRLDRHEDDNERGERSRELTRQKNTMGLLGGGGRELVRELFPLVSGRRRHGVVVVCALLALVALLSQLVRLPCHEADEAVFASAAEFLLVPVVREHSGRESERNVTPPCTRTETGETEQEGKGRWTRLSGSIKVSPREGERRDSL